MCSELYLVANLDGGVVPGEIITNTAFITASTDLESGDNEAIWEGQAGERHVNLSVDKYRNWGLLVPGGEIHYSISFHNGGNVNNDCTVNILDLSFMGARYTFSCGDPGWDAKADINNDCTVNILDLAVTGGSFQKSCPVPWPESKLFPVIKSRWRYLLMSLPTFSLFNPTWKAFGDPP